jgi:hypothetical protein
MAKKRPQDGPHVVLKNIRYHGDGPLGGKLVKGGEGTVLTFAHLDDSGYALLVKTGYIQPEKEGK